MLNESNLHNYQKRAVKHSTDNPCSALFLDAGLGKEQPNSELVLTPNGWVTMGSIKKGDFVISPTGDKTKVVGVYPQGKKKVYEISFNDKTSCFCGLDHLWKVAYKSTKKKDIWHIKSLGELLEEGITHKYGRRKFRIPITNPVKFSNKELKIDPYLMGVVLGDGNIRKKGYVILTTDQEIAYQYLDYGNLTQHESEGIVNLSLKKDCFKKAIIDYGLAGKLSDTKFVPPIYLIASIPQRHALLQGLLDTDGHAHADSGVEFCSTSRSLIDSVIDITQSLGGIAREGKVKLKPKYTTSSGRVGYGKTAYRVNLKLPNEFPPFRLSRKLNKWVPTTKYPCGRLIADIIPKGYEESTCIAVESEAHLYLTRNHIVTHNTISALTTIVNRMDNMQVYGTLVVSTLRVVQSVWESEAAKWEQSKHLTFSFAHGSEVSKIRAIDTPHDIYLINYEGLEWLSDHLQREYLTKGKYLPFNMVVLDECSKMKSPNSVRHKAYRKFCLYAPYRIGLTGTPACSGLKDLFGQFLAIDGGERLGVSEHKFKETYFNKSGYMGYGITEKTDTQSLITAKIADITLQMKTADYLELPPVIYNNVAVHLTPKVRQQYEDLERELFLKLDEEGSEVEAVNMAALSMKIRQLTGGSIITDSESGEWSKVHDLKLDALSDIIEESAGNPVLCFYQFTHERSRILKKYKDAEFFKSGMPKEEVESIIRRWNNNEIPLLIAHCQSAAHGLNLQHAMHSCIVWFGLPWSLEYYLQANARIARQGVLHTVIIHLLLCPDTIDEAILLSLEDKASTEEAMRDAVAAYRKKKFGD